MVTLGLRLQLLARLQNVSNETVIRRCAAAHSKWAEYVRRMRRRVLLGGPMRAAWRRGARLVDMEAVPRALQIEYPASTWWAARVAMRAWARRLHDRAGYESQERRHWRLAATAQRALVAVGGDAARREEGRRGGWRRVLLQHWKLRRRRRATSWTPG